MSSLTFTSSEGESRFSAIRYASYGVMRGQAPPSIIFCPTFNPSMALTSVATSAVNGMI